MKKTLLLTVFLFLVLAKLTIAQVPDFVPTDNLIGWWPFEGNANDLSLNAYHGTFVGASTLTTDRFGTLNRAFQGGSSYVTCPSTVFRFARTDNFSFSVWFTKATNNNGRLVSTESDEGHFRVSCAGTNISIQFGDYLNLPMNDNNWHQIVYTYSSRNEKIYLDGILTITNNDSPINDEALNYSRPFTIGAKASPSHDTWNGKIDDIGVWSRVLTQTEVTNLYNSCAPPSITGTTPLSRCDAGTVALGASASSGTINWYSSSTGGSSLQTGTSFTTPSINATTTYYVDATNNGCTSSSRTAIVATVNSTPTVISTTPLSRCDAGTVALGASASSGTINWYSSSTGGSSLQTGTSFTTPSINATTTYYVDATNNGCTSSSRTAIVATVNSTPTVISTTPLSRCDAGTVALGASASSGTINWYSSSTGGSSLQTGTSFTTPSINTTTNYYVDATNNGCTSSSRTAVVATVNSTPTVISTTPLSRCDAGTVALGASASSGTINWYSSSTGGSSLQTGTSFTTPSINATTTYYVDATNNGCTSSSRTAIVATVNSTPTVISTTPLSRCDAGTVALGASASSGTINWYSSSTGGSSLQTGTSFTTPSINTTTNYYVDATNNGCTSSSRTAIVATVNSTPTVISTTPLSRCDAGTVALGASASSGTINWYSSSTGGSSLQTGTSFTTPSINTTTNYYVDATNNGCTSSSRTAVVATVNSSPTITGTTPLSRCDAGTVALGASASSGTINWYSSSTGGSSLQAGTSYTTPLINTTTSYYVDATNNGCTSSSRTAIVATVNASPTITGTTPLSRCDAGTVVLGASASSGTINWYSSSTGGSSLQTGTSYTTPSINTTTTYYVEATNNGCTSSSRTAIVATVNASPTITGTTPLSRCDEGTVALEATPSVGVINWYSSSTGGSSLQAGTSYTTPSINTTTTYYVEATNNGCTSSSRTALVATVNASPTITGTTPLSRCDAGTVVLGASASSGTINWYSSSTGGSSLQTGTIFTTPSINTTTTYYVDVTNNGCTSSSRTAILATVNTTPTITGTTPLSRCDAGTVVLGASAISGTINWYSSSTGGSSLQTGTSYTTPSINTTATYYVDVTNNGCTSSSRTAIVATVNTAPTITSTTPLSRCDAGTVALGASASSGTINWYSSSTGGSLLQTGTSFTTPSINTTTTYYVDATNNGCTSSSRTAVVATVNASPTITGTTPLSRCDAGTVALGASASSGTINWYSSSTGGSLLQTGTSFTTPFINATTSYYAEATNSGCISSSRTAVVATVKAIPVKPAISWDGIQLSTTSTIENYQWLLNNNSIASASSSIFKPIEIGNYKIQITGVNGCKNESESFMLLVKADNNLVKIFPNPASKYVMVYLSQKPTQSLTMKLFNLHGQELKQIIINNQITYIPLSEILVGNYVIKIFGKEFSQTKQLTIVQ